MAVAAPPQNPLVVAAALRAEEAEIRRLLPAAPATVVALALQAMDNKPLLTPEYVAILSVAQTVPAVEEQRYRAAAKWDEWATDYSGILRQLRALIEKTASQSAP